MENEFIEMMGNENAANDTTAEVREENAAACEEIAKAGGESAAVSDDAAIEEPGSFERMGGQKTSSGNRGHGL